MEGFFSAISSQSCFGVRYGTSDGQPFGGGLLEHEESVVSGSGMCVAGEPHCLSIWMGAKVGEGVDVDSIPDRSDHCGSGHSSFGCDRGGGPAGLAEWARCRRLIP